MWIWTFLFLIGGVESLQIRSHISPVDEFPFESSGSPGLPTALGCNLFESNETIIKRASWNSQHCCETFNGHHHVIHSWVVDFENVHNSSQSCCIPTCIPRHLPDSVPLQHSNCPIALPPPSFGERLWVHVSDRWYPSVQTHWYVGDPYIRQYQLISSVFRFVHHLVFLCWNFQFRHHMCDMTCSIVACRHHALHRIYTWPPLVRYFHVDDSLCCLLGLAAPSVSSQHGCIRICSPRCPPDDVHLQHSVNSGTLVSFSSGEGLWVHVSDRWYPSVQSHCGMGDLLLRRCHSVPSVSRFVLHLSTSCENAQLGRNSCHNPHNIYACRHPTSHNLQAWPICFWFLDPSCIPYGLGCQLGHEMHWVVTYHIPSWITRLDPYVQPLSLQWNFVGRFTFIKIGTFLRVGFYPFFTQVYDHFLHPRTLKPALCHDNVPDFAGKMNGWNYQPYSGMFGRCVFIETYLTWLCRFRNNVSYFLRLNKFVCVFVISTFVDGCSSHLVFSDCFSNILCLYCSFTTNQKGWNSIGSKGDVSCPHSLDWAVLPGILASGIKSPDQILEHPTKGAFHRLLGLACLGKRLWAHVLDRWCPSVWNLSKSELWFFGRIPFVGGNFPIGEAKNPGPIDGSESCVFPSERNRLIIGTINPTQVFGKEDILCNIGDGIWACSETSHTATSRMISHRRVVNNDWKIVWSFDNEPLYATSGLIRGRAAGTCVMSILPLVPSHHNLPSDIWKSCRYCETIAQINHNTKLMVISLYGPTHNGTHVNPDGVMFTLMGHAIERGSAFQGPVVITGDLNNTLDKIPPWAVAYGRGWKDLHKQSSEMLGHPLEPTCKNARHSFILGNPQVVTALSKCRTVETYDFAAHPILYAELDFDTLCEDCMQWWLPKSMDCVYLDQTLMEEAADNFLHPIKHEIQDALTRGDTEKAFQLFISSYEQAAAASAVDCSGNQISLPKACLGKGHGLPFRCRPPTMPTNRPGRGGDVQPFQLQQGVQLRRILKQVRRLQALENQLRACYDNYNEIAAMQCQDLWISILKATGFPGGFKKWILLNGEGFVPYQCPHREYVSSLKEKLHTEYKQRSMEAFLIQKQQRKVRVTEEIMAGGRRMFQEIRGTTSPPLSQVAFHTELKVAKQKWPKTGLSVIKLEPSPEIHDFVVGGMVCFQNQNAELVRISDSAVVVSPPLRLRNYHDFSIKQKHRTAVRSVMQKHAAIAWNSFWQRDIEATAETWEDCLPLLTGPCNCPSLQFEEFRYDRWIEVVRKIPNRSSRGACGFSKKELIDLSPSFVSILFQFFAAFEAGHAWPQRWAIAKVVCLNKVEVPDSALDCRPITVLSRLYRCWSSYRSRQILKHLANIIPPQVAGTCGVMSADLLVGLTLTEIENTPSGGAKFGCVLDLKKCYNLIPRVPMFIMLAALKIPIQYIQGFATMLSCMQRTFIIAGGAGDLHFSFTGIAEGCSFSVACMCALSYFASRQFDSIPAVIPVFFADNWSAITETLDNLRRCLSKLDEFTTSLKMVFSATKSWVWTSGKVISKALRNLQIQGETIPVRHSAVDLGCDTTYKGRSSRIAANKRFGKAKDLLKAIQRKKLPNKFRGTAIKLAGHGNALYGSEIGYTPPNKWHSLRSQTAGALNQGTCGVSPWLLLSCCDPTLDPQYRSLVRKIKFWRRFFKIFPQHKGEFLQKVCNFSIRGNGPAISFRKSFADVEWTCLPGGWLQHSTGLKFKWDECSRTLMHKILSHAWTSQVSQSTGHRKYMDISAFDISWHSKNHESFV